MTDDRMALIELTEKQADGDLVRERACAAGRLMATEPPRIRSMVSRPSSTVSRPRARSCALSGSLRSHRLAIFTRRTKRSY